MTVQKTVNVFLPITIRSFDNVLAHPMILGMNIVGYWFLGAEFNTY